MTEEQFLGELFDEVTRRVEAGERVDPQSYVRKYPERAEQIEKLLPVLDLLIGAEMPAPEKSTIGEAAVAEHELPDASATDQLIGDYRIVREVGRGGMGVVYEAEQVSLGRKVALKVLPFASVFDKRQIGRFQNEAQAAARLHHQHIVPVFATGCERGVHYYAMQFIEGQTLAETVAELRERPAVRQGSRGDRFPEQAAARSLLRSTDSDAKPSTNAASSSPTSRELVRAVAEIGVQTASALAYAHQVGVVHRDVKPANLLLDSQGNVWITDFGLAQFSGEQSLTLSGDLLGTLRYMSPEQSLGKRLDVDERTDVYSLGVTLYELLTLRPAISGKDREEILRKVSFEDPVPPRKLNPAVPHELETIILKAIEKNPRERYASAADFAEDLRSFLEHKPIRARRPTIMQRAVKWSRRHRTLVVSLLVASVVALLITAAGASGLALYFGGVAESNRLESERNLQVARENDKRRRELETLAERRRERLVRSFVANGSQRFEDGDIAGALLWFTSALQEDPGDRENEAAHRLRISAMLDRCPRPRRFWSSDLVRVSLPWSGTSTYFVSDSNRWWLYDEVEDVAIEALTGNVSRHALRSDGQRLFTFDGTEGAIWDIGSREKVATLDASIERLRRIKFTLDGRRIVTARNVGPSRWKSLVEVWDAETGRRVGPPLESAAPEVYCSPHGDLVAVHRGMRVDVHDAASGRSVLPAGRSIEHGEWVSSTHFSADGRRLVTAGGGDGKAQVFRIDTWERIALFEHEGVVKSARLGPHGRVLATGEMGGVVRIWDVDSGRLLRHRRVRKYKPLHLHFSPDGRYLLTPSGDAALLWDYQADTTTELRSGTTANTASFSADGRFVYVEGDGGLTVWDFAIAPPDSPALAGSRSTLFSDASGLWGTRFTTARQPDGGLRVRDLYVGHALSVDRSGSPTVWTIASSPDGRFLATAGIDGTARIWNATTFLPVAEPLHHAEPIIHIVFDPQGRHLVSVSGRFARVWDVASGKPRTPPLRHEGNLSDVSVSPDGQRLATAGDDGTVRLWKLEGGEPVGVPFVHDRPVMLSRFSPDGKRLVTSTRDSNDYNVSSVAGAVHVWDVATQKLERKLGKVWATRLAFSPDGQRVLAAFASPVGRGVVWDLETGKEVARALPHGCAECAHFRADGQVMVTGGLDQRAIVSDVLTGEPRRTLDLGAPVFDVRFSPDGSDGSWLLTATHGGQAQLWDFQQFEWVTPPFQHPGSLRRATFTPDGRSILTASVVGLARELVPDDRPVDTLLDLARLLAGRKVDRDNNRLVALPANELRVLRARMKDDHPQELVLPQERVMSWHQSRAEDAYHAERWSEALAHLDLALKDEPSRFPNLVMRGHLHATLGQWRNAAADFERAITLGETDPWIRHCEALARLAGEDAEGFHNSAERLSARLRGQSSTGAMRWLAWTCVLAPDAVDDLDSVSRRLREAQGKSMEERMTALCHGALLYRRGELARATPALRAAIEADTDSPTRRFALLFLALNEAAQGKDAEAFEAFEQARTVAIGDGFWSVETALQLLENEVRTTIASAASPEPGE